MENKTRSEVEVVIVHTMTRIDNVYVFKNRESAIEKVISLANYLFDRSFKTEKEVLDYIDSEQYLDANHDYMVSWETSILEEN